MSVHGKWRNTAAVTLEMQVRYPGPAAEECPVWPGKAEKRIHHSFVDPARAEGTLEERKQVFRAVRDEMLEVIPKILNT